MAALVEEHVDAPIELSLSDSMALRDGTAIIPAPSFAWITPKTRLAPGLLTAVAELVRALVLEDRIGSGGTVPHALGF